MKELILRNLITNSRNNFGERKALSFYDAEGFTYNQLHSEVLKLALKLYNLGIRKGDKVAILSVNSPNWGVSYLATVYLGAITVPILNDFSKKEIGNILEHSEAKALFVSENLKVKVDNNFQFVRYVFNIDNFTINQSLSPLPEPESDREQIPEKTDLQAEEQFDSYSEDDLASIIYTSGTTGSSKGVMLSHKNLISNINSTFYLQKVVPEDRFLSLLPLPHSYECTVGFLMPLQYGASINYLHGLPTPGVLLPALEKVKPTILLSVPLIIEKIYRSKILPAFSKGIVKKLYSFPLTRILLNRLAGKKLMKTFGGKIHFFGIGGALLDPVVERFLIEAKFPYAIGYGLTETSPLLAGASPRTVKYRSTGFSPPGQQLKLININPKTGEGEVVAMGDNIMKGYYKDEEKTRECFTNDGWFRTGDLGFMNKKNRLYIRGRLKNMIVGASGENIYPEAIESVVNNHRLVLESIVYELKGKLVAKV
ncbi:MAG: AMP-binding protein, partial [Bacteroidales bacterium]|nr:AMP-binding protein [Bacteroidales bacterium]